MLLAQGEMIDRIEYHVEHAVDYVQTATQVLSKHLDNQQLLLNSFTKCICAGHKEGAEVPVKGPTGEKTF